MEAVVVDGAKTACCPGVRACLDRTCEAAAAVLLLKMATRAMRTAVKDFMVEMELVLEYVATESCRKRSMIACCEKSQGKKIVRMRGL